MFLLKDGEPNLCAYLASVPSIQSVPCDHEAAVVFLCARSVYAIDRPCEPSKPLLFKPEASLEIQIDYRCEVMRLLP